VKNRWKKRRKKGNKLCDCFKYHFVYSAHMIYPPPASSLLLSFLLCVCGCGFPSLYNIIVLFLCVYVAQYSSLSACLLFFLLKSILSCTWSFMYFLFYLLTLPQSLSFCTFLPFSSSSISWFLCPRMTDECTYVS
jgi:hypothetical protein